MVHYRVCGGSQRICLCATLLPKVQFIKKQYVNDSENLQSRSPRAIFPGQVEQDPLDVGRGHPLGRQLALKIIPRLGLVTLREGTLGFEKVSFHQRSTLGLKSPLTVTPAETDEIVSLRRLYTGEECS